MLNLSENLFVFCFCMMSPSFFDFQFNKFLRCFIAQIIFDKFLSKIWARSLSPKCSKHNVSHSNVDTGKPIRRCLRVVQMKIIFLQFRLRNITIMYWKMLILCSKIGYSESFCSFFYFEKFIYRTSELSQKIRPSIPKIKSIPWLLLFEGSILRIHSARESTKFELSRNY